MRVLHAITSLGTGGAEKLLLDSIPAYIKKGIHTELLLLSGNKHVFYKELEENGVVIHNLTYGNIRKIYNPLLVFKIIPYLKKYDVIHVHLFPTLYWVAIAKILSFSSTKLIFTEHNTENRRIGKPIWNIIDSFIYSRYYKIISISLDVDRNIKKHLEKIDKRKFEVINNGVNLLKYNYPPEQRELGLPKRKKECIIIQVSGFRDQKDHITLIKSLCHLPHYIILQLVGVGKNRGKCEELVQELNLKNRIIFLGERSDVPELLKQADIGVLSSNYEGFGLVAVESMASGLPFIASDVPGLCDVVGGAGLLFPKGDEVFLASLINKLVENDEFYYQISEACFNRAQVYNIDIMVDKYINLYKSICK